jgi:hypothetical protein
MLLEAFDGTHALVVMLRVTGSLPTFFTYTKQDFVSPGDRVPQLINVVLFVPALSQKTPTPFPVTVPVFVIV